MRCWHLGAEELAKYEIKVEHTIRLEFYMTISRNTRKLFNIMRNFYKFVRVLMIVMVKPWLIIVLELIIN
jgi:hypothetical protein